MEYIDIGNVFMQKRPRKEIQLGEATVKATKQMMVMKGDTLVYNADAFQLAEGSMLDKLIAMLPGVELKKDGVITENGRRVDRLLVNGEDFFTGSPKVALENLPAYTVDKVKVYERMNDRDRALGYTKEEVGKQPLAMDVQLKKQYSMGGFANVGGAYGTDGHYGARLFALRFTRQSRIGAYANINDFMGGSYYDSNGNWQTASGGSMATTKDAGLYYLINDRRQRFEVDGNTRFWYHKDPTESKTSTTTFFDSGDVFSRTRQRSVAHELVADAAFKIQITPPEKGLFMLARPQFNYRNYDRTDGSQSADWNRELTERYMGEALDSLFSPDAASHLRENLISSLETNSLAKGHSFRGGGTLQGSWRVPNSSDAVDFSAGGNYNYTADRTLRTSTTTNQADPMPGDEARFTDRTAKNYNFFANGTYNFQWDFGDRMSFFARPHYGYSHNYQSARNPYYVLEGTAFDTWNLDQLASNRSALQDQINAQNSYYSTRREQSHTGSLLLGIRKQINTYRSWEINFTPAVNYVYERLDYDRDRIDTLMRRRRTYFEPYVWLFFQPYNNSQLYLDYRYSRQAPDLLSLLDYEDTSDPLVRRFGNPGLRDTRTHHTSFRYHVLEGKEYKYNVSIEVHHRIWLDAVAQGMTYNAQTGVRTYRPENVNGNWELTSKHLHDAQVRQSSEIAILAQRRPAHQRGLPQQRRPHQPRRHVEQRAQQRAHAGLDRTRRPLGQLQPVGIRHLRQGDAQPLHGQLHQPHERLRLQLRRQPRRAPAVEVLPEHHGGRVQPPGVHGQPFQHGRRHLERLAEPVHPERHAQLPPRSVRHPRPDQPHGLHHQRPDADRDVA